MINPLVKRNHGLMTAGLAQLVYGLGEVGDSLYLLLLQIRLLPNLYPAWEFSEIDNLMRTRPAVLIPIFAFFAIGRLLAAGGVLHNRLWGFWLSLFLSAATVFCAVFFLPLGGIDLLACLFIVSALLIGRFGREPILPTQKG
ncbi:MAG: hypothetical protein JW748_01865 [Anaerolineales bacterium]|nr:hypothetical protein [Anaerolineales bacterium]